MRWGQMARMRSSSCIATFPHDVAARTYPKAIARHSEHPLVSHATAHLLRHLSFLVRNLSLPQHIASRMRRNGVVKPQCNCSGLRNFLSHRLPARQRTALCMSHDSVAQPLRTALNRPVVVYAKPLIRHVALRQAAMHLGRVLRPGACKPRAMQRAHAGPLCP